MKIYFGAIGIHVEYILANISNFYQKIYPKYILIIQLFAKIYFISFDIYVTYILIHVGIPYNLRGEPALEALKNSIFFISYIASKTSQKYIPELL